jgi:hypothetical protein
VGNSAEGPVASGSRTLESAAGGDTQDERSFEDLALETSKEKVVDNLLNVDLRWKTPASKDKLDVVQLSGEMKPATQFSPMLLCEVLPNKNNRTKDGTVSSW